MGLLLLDSGFGGPSDFGPSLKVWPDSSYGVYADGAAHFTAASSQYLYGSDTGMPTGTASKSFTAWVKIDATDSSDRVIFWYGGAGTGGKLTIYKNSSNKLQLTQFGSGITGTTTLSTGWCHVVLTVSGSDYTLYLNEIVEATGTLTTNTSLGGTFNIGAEGGAATFNGSIDSPGFYAGVFTADDIAELNASGAGATWNQLSAGLQAKFNMTGGFFYDMNEESGTRYDASTNNRDLTASNAVLISPSVNNGGFETAGAGGADVFANWVESVSGTTTISKETTIVQAGSAAAKLVIDGLGSGAFLSQSICRAGDKYQYSYYARTGSGSATVGVADGSGHVAATTISATYTNYTGIHSPADAYFYIYSQAAGATIYLDTITLTDLGPQCIAGIAAGVATDGNFCAQFDGTNQYLSLASNATVNSSGGDMWWSQWVWIDNKKTFPASLNKLTNSGQFAYRIYLDTTADQFAGVVSPDGTTLASLNATSFGSPALAQWHFIFMRYDKTLQKLYISVNNGAENELAGVTGIFAGGDQLEIGAHATPGRFWQGRIDTTLIGKLASGTLASIASSVRTALFNDGKGYKAKALTAAQITSYGVVAGWDQDKQLGITADSIGTNTLTNNNGVTYAQGVDYYAGAVSKQLDRSGNGKNLTQTTMASRPTFQTNIQNGKPGILFNGSSTLIENTNAGLPVGTAARTVFLVFKQTIVQNSFPLFWNAGGANHCGIDINGTFKVYLENYYDSGITINNNTCYVVAFTFSGGNIATYVNGVAGATFSSIVPAATGTASLALGAIPGPTIFFGGYVFDGAIYNSALTSGQIAQEFNYFRSKWAVY